MLKQNIKIAIIAIIGFLTLWLVVLNFIKIDIATQSIVNFQNKIPYAAIDVKTSSYIENKELSYVKLLYNKQSFNCPITFSSAGNEYNYYLIVLPSVVDQTGQYLVLNLIIDSLNVYQYVFK